MGEVCARRAVGEDGRGIEREEEGWWGMALTWRGRIDRMLDSKDVGHQMISRTR